MKRLVLLSIASFAPFFISAATAQVAVPEVQPLAPGANLSLELLSDSSGADMSPYVRRMMSDLKKHWQPPVAEASNRPLTKPQETAISLTIGRDGQIVAMNLEKRASDVALDKAAWNAAKETSYLPLPSGLKDKDLQLRVRFVVN